MKFFSFLLIALFATTLGCDSKTKEMEAKKGPNQLVFVESSKGLPLKNQWRQNIAFYDINGDGHLDILAPPPRKAPEGHKRPVVWYGNGKGEWSKFQPDVPPDIPYDYGGITVSDFDGDGIADIALAIHGSGVKVLKGEGGGRYVDFSDGLPLKEEFTSRAVVSLDVNNDGISDIAALSEGTGNGVVIFYRSNNTWIKNPVDSEEKKPFLFGDRLATGDVNGDGNADIAVGSLQHTKDLIVWIGDGKGGFTPFNKGLPQQLHYPAVWLADLDNDGRDDLIASITGFGREAVKVLKAFLSRPDGFEDISEGLPTEEVFLSVTACDLGRDGSVEIIGGTGEGIKVFSRKENQWREASVSGLPTEGLVTLYNVYCVDLNKDGYKDIAVNYASERGNSGAIRVFLNVPDNRSSSEK